MKQKFLYAGVLFLAFIQFTLAQNIASDYLVRSTTGVAGSSEIFSAGNKQYVVQQSIGQASVIGTFYQGDVTLRQGFIQPYVWAKSIEAVLPVNLEVVIYPNPFTENLTLSFSEKINASVEVSVFDLLGRLVFSGNYAASQSINIRLSALAGAEYMIKGSTGNKQFIKKVLKR